MADYAEHEQWVNREMTCAACSLEWVASVIIGLVAIQCPRCGELTDGTLAPIADHEQETSVGDVISLTWHDTKRREQGRVIDPPEWVSLLRLMLDDGKEISAIYHDGKLFRVADDSDEENASADPVDPDEPWRKS